MVLGLIITANSANAAEFMTDLAAPVSDLNLLNNAELSDEDLDKFPQEEEENKFSLFKTKKRMKPQDETISSIDANISVGDTPKEEKKTVKERLSGLNLPKVNLPLLNKKKEEAVTKKSDNNEVSDVQIEADFLEYYPEKSEIEAIGNAKIYLPSQDVTLYANKIVFNHDLNTVVAKDNVKLVNQDSETTGDFINLNLSSDEGIIENPITNTYEISIKAKEGRVYSDRIEEYDGVAKILKNYDLKFAARSFASYVNPGRLDLHEETMKASDSGIYHLKTQEIKINSEEEHNIITMKNTGVYAKKIKIGVVPQIQVVSGKQSSTFETNIPEFGSASNIGLYAGPAIVLNMPKSSTLKVAPLLTYSDNKLGFGGFARFLHDKNRTEIMYGSSEDKFLINGQQMLTDRLSLRYSQNTYQDEWFLGFRRPRYSADLQYNRADFVEDLGLTFTQRYSAGYFVDEDDQIGQGEMRMRWMTQGQKSFYRYQNRDKNVLVDAGLISQTAATVYSKGDVTGLFRFGPILTTRLGPWKQSLIYFQSATAGESPFAFDKYAYGKSNFVFVEELKICKYLTIGYLGSIALLRDSSFDDNMWQENKILLSVGPDYAKFTLGYDVNRQSTMLTLSMLVGAKDSEIEFKKATYKTNDKEEKKGFINRLVNI